LGEAKGEGFPCQWIGLEIVPQELGGIGEIEDGDCGNLGDEGVKDGLMSGKDPLKVGDSRQLRHICPHARERLASAEEAIEEGFRATGLSPEGIGIGITI
jgi:hypothetical protein